MVCGRRPASFVFGLFLFLRRLFLLHAGVEEDLVGEDVEVGVVDLGGAFEGCPGGGVVLEAQLADGEGVLGGGALRIGV